MYSSRAWRLAALILLAWVLGAAAPAGLFAQAVAPPLEAPAQQSQSSESEPQAAPETPGETDSEDKQSPSPEGDSANSPEGAPDDSPAATPDEKPDEKPEEQPADEPTEKPTEEATESQSEESAPARKDVPWDEEIEKIVGLRYPRNVDELRRVQQQVQSVVEHARPCVVAVQLGDSVGSGVIVNEEGLVLTAGHVAMEPNRRVQFLFPDGSRARGRTLGVNRTIDSGMMQITDKGPWPSVKMATPGELRNGDWVVCLGQPNGYFRDRAPPVRIGRVLYQDDDVINTDATLVGGDSGGPLLNLKGEVVGIHSRIGRRITSNFHVPISTYELTWDRLVAGEIWGGGIPAQERASYRPMLGVTSNPRGESCRVQVIPNSPAAQAGLKSGDVITRYGDAEVSSFDELARRVLKQRPGARFRLEVRRGDKTLEFSGRLGRVSPDYPGAAPMDSSAELAPSSYDAEEVRL